MATEHLEQYRIAKAPANVYYVPNFVTADEERYLLGRVLNAPKPKWEHLSHRRLQNWGGMLGKKGLIVDGPMPDWLETCIDKICKLDGIFPDGHRPNHVLVNEYLPGQGIMPHVDGPMYYPVVATISLGGHTMFDFYERAGLRISEVSASASDDSMKMPSGVHLDAEANLVPVGSMLLESRSLVISTDEAYTKYLHGIKEIDEDVIEDGLLNRNACSDGLVNGESLKRDVRISLTIRNIPKVTYLNKFAQTRC